MRNKKRAILVIIIMMLFIAILIAILLATKSSSGTLIETTEEERNFWNDFLKKSPYIAEIKYLYPNQIMKDNEEILKIALLAEEVEIEYINEEDIKNNFLLTEGEGYKKSKKEIDKYLKKLLGIDSFRYNAVMGNIGGGTYLIDDENYVYFTKIKVPEKIYIAINYEEQDEEYTVEIYEYIVTDENRDKLEEMLKTGNINSKIEKSNIFIITGKKTEDGIAIDYKYASENGKKEVEEIMNSLPK